MHHDGNICVLYIQITLCAWGTSWSPENFSGSLVCRFHTQYLWTIYCVCACKLESLPGIIWKFWNLPAGKFTVKQLYCWNSDKSTPVYDFENRARCEQLNILYTVAWPPGGCNIESVYFDWHFSFFFSSRHYCCKWYLCSIWICSSKNCLDIWTNIFWTSSFIIVMIFGRNPATVQQTGKTMSKSKQTCIMLVHQITWRWDFQNFFPM